jgi:hypothetical protein
LNHHDDFDYFLDNLGPWKQYPRGPVCTFKDKEVPCMVEFSSVGRMSGAILTKIFATLDALKLFDEATKEGRRPFVLLDGHNSHFDFEFLE